jgi:hypothetical protein|tara:strand:- start:395 stop:583 length:189 start_codon:yes stop_codon:yes gene_type:complete
MEKIKKGLELGRTISQYPTGRSGYSEYFRWDDTLEVVNCKSVWALRRKGYEVKINISNKIVK